MKPPSFVNKLHKNMLPCLPMSFQPSIIIIPSNALSSFSLRTLNKTNTHARLQTLSKTPTCTNGSHSISIPPHHTSFIGSINMMDTSLYCNQKKKKKKTFFTSPNSLARKQTKHSSRLPPIKPPPKQKQPSSSGCLFCSAVLPACATNASKKGLAGSSRRNVMARNGDGEEFGRKGSDRSGRRKSRGSQCSGHHSRTLAWYGDRRHTEKEEGMRLFFPGRQEQVRAVVDRFLLFIPGGKSGARYICTWCGGIYVRGTYCVL